MPVSIRVSASDQPVVPWRLADGSWAKAVDTLGVEWTTRENPNGTGPRLWIKAKRKRKVQRTLGASDEGDELLLSGVALRRCDPPRRVLGSSDEGDELLLSGVALEVRPTRVLGASDEGDELLLSGVALELRPTRVLGASDEGDELLLSGVAREQQSAVTMPGYIEKKARKVEAQQAGEADDGMSPQQQEEQWKRVSAATCEYVDAGLASDPSARMYIAVGMFERMSQNLAIAKSKDWTCLAACEMFRILLCPNPYAYAVIGGNMVKFNAKILRKVHLLSRFSPPLPLSPCSPRPPPMAVP